jgi:hypothetical protein
MQRPTDGIAKALLQTRMAFYAQQIQCVKGFAGFFDAA